MRFGSVWCKETPVHLTRWVCLISVAGFRFVSVLSWRVRVGVKSLFSIAHNRIKILIAFHLTSPCDLNTKRMEQHPPQPPPPREPQPHHPDKTLFPFLTDEFIDNLTNPQMNNWLCSLHPSIRKTMRKSERREALKFWRDFATQEQGDLFVFVIF